MWKTFRNLLAQRANTRYTPNNPHPLPFFLQHLYLPVSPSSKSKIINHPPADKISCSMAEQLQHLVESCDEVRSRFPLSQLPLGSFRTSPTSCQKLYTCSSSDKSIKKTKKQLYSTCSADVTAMNVKSPWWIHVTSQGVCTSEED